MRHTRTAARQTHSRETTHKAGEEGGESGVGSLGAGAAAIRAYCLSRSEVRVSDLQSVYRLSFSGACRALEELEALRLMGSMPTAGARHWSVRYPVDEERVAMLRRAFGWGANVLQGI